MTWVRIFIELYLYLFNLIIHVYTYFTHDLVTMIPLSVTFRDFMTNSYFILSMYEFAKLDILLLLVFNIFQVILLFELGGHPRNWQSIVTPSLDLIHKFCEKLKQNNCLEEKPITQLRTSPSALLQTDLNKIKQTKFSLLQKWQQVFFFFVCIKLKVVIIINIELNTIS